MPTITIKNIPRPLYKRLKVQAARHHRSLNLEVIACLEQTTGSTLLDPATILAHARELRKLCKGPILTDKRLMQLKTAGRP